MPFLIFRFIIGHFRLELGTPGQYVGIYTNNLGRLFQPLEIILHDTYGPEKVIGHSKKISEQSPLWNNTLSSGHQPFVYPFWPSKGVFAFSDKYLMVMGCTHSKTCKLNIVYLAVSPPHVLKVAICNESIWGAMKFCFE